MSLMETGRGQWRNDAGWLFPNVKPNSIYVPGLTVGISFWRGSSARLHRSMLRTQRTLVGIHLRIANGDSQHHWASS